MRHTVRLMKAIAPFAAVILIAAACLKEDASIPEDPSASSEALFQETLRSTYDAIVVGSDPEGVTAAVSAARNGLDTLLLDGSGRDRLGGLMTLGWLNTIDMNYGPGKRVLNGGLFQEWYARVEGDSFDVDTASRAFLAMTAKEEKLHVRLGLVDIEPIVEEGADGGRTVTGVSLTLEDGSTRRISAAAVIDATQDADFAARAGAPYTVGREDLGYEDHAMAVTLVFRLSNVTPDVWKQIGARLRRDGDEHTGVNARSAWGYPDMKSYAATMHPERIRMRGLNLGRQDGDKVLVNALQIFGVDALDAASRREAREIAAEELPHVVEELRLRYPEFAGVELDGAAPELYVRETRHIEGEYRLTIVDVCENRDHWDRIAFGSYPVDIQRVTPEDYGAVVCNPKQYAIPFRSLVPLQVDGLLVVGRAASYDSLPHGSARVIPVGMAAGQAAGAAVRTAMDGGMTLRQLSKSEEGIARLQQRLTEQGVDLRPYDGPSAPWTSHADVRAFRSMLSLGVVVGGYENRFPLEETAEVRILHHALKAMHRVYPEAFPGDPRQALESLAAERGEGIDALLGATLGLGDASFLLARTLGLDTTREEAHAHLLRIGITGTGDEPIADPGALRYAEAYRLAQEALDGRGLGGESL